MRSLWHYLRFIWDTPPDEGSPPNLAGGPPEAPPPGAEQIRQETQAMLDHLAMDIESNKENLTRIAQALKTERPHQWLLSYANVQGAIPTIERAFVTFEGKPLPGIDKLINGLRASEDSPEYKAAFAALQKIVQVLDTYQQKLTNSKEQSDKIKEDVLTQKAGEWTGNIMDTFRRGSGVEKVLTVGSIAFGIYMIMKTDWLKKAAKYGGAIFALNYLVGVASGQSIFERLGLFTSLDQLPNEAKHFAESIGMKDPRQVVGLAKLGGKSMDRLYQLYGAHNRNGVIPPEAVGFYEKELNGQEIYQMIHGLVKKCGSQKEFQDRYVGKGYSFLQVVLALNGAEVLNRLGDIDPQSKQQFIHDQQEIFKGEGQFVIVDSHVTLGGIRFPELVKRMVEGDGKDKKNIIYSYDFGDGKQVHFRLEEEASLRTHNFNLLRQYMKELIVKRLEGTPLASKTVELLGNIWKVRGVEIKPNVTKDIELRQGGGEAIDFYVDGLRLMSGMSLEQAYNQQKNALLLQRNIPFFNGMHLEITRVRDGGKKMDGMISGAPFTVHILSPTSFQIIDEEALIKHPSFLAAKKDQLRDLLNQGSPQEFQKPFHYQKFKSIMEHANENHLTLKLTPPFFWNLSGNVSEALWEATVDMKMDNALNIFEQALMRAKNVTEAHTIEQQFRMSIYGASERLYKKIEGKVSLDEEFKDHEFEGMYHELLGIGFISSAAQTEIARVSDRLMNEVNVEGIDGSDTFKGWADVHQKVMGDFLRFLAPLAPKAQLGSRDMAYIRYVEAQMFKKIGLFTRKSGGVIGTDIHESLNLENIGDFEVVPYDQFQPGIADGLEPFTGGGAVEGGREVPSEAYAGLVLFEGAPALQAGDITRWAPDQKTRGPVRMSRNGIVKMMNWIVLREEKTIIDLGSGQYNPHELKKHKALFFDKDRQYVKYKKDYQDVWVQDTLPKQVAALQGYRNSVRQYFALTKVRESQ